MKICHVVYKYETFFCNVSSLFLRKLENIIIKRAARELTENPSTYPKFSLYQSIEKRLETFYYTRCGIPLALQTGQQRGHINNSSHKCLCGFFRHFLENVSCRIVSRLSSISCRRCRLCWIPFLKDFAQCLC